MPIKKPLLFFFILLIFATLSAHAQSRKNENALLRFFQNNFDSTIVYHIWSSWNASPNYCIVAKKDSGIYFFTYMDPYLETPGRYFPGNLMEKFSAAHFQFQRTEPDTNRYFLPFKIYPTDRKKAWTDINAFHICQTADEPTIKSKCDVHDGSHMAFFFLLTKDSIRVLDYYEPETFEKCGPTNSDRQNVIKTQKEFALIFKVRPYGQITL